LGAKRQHSLLGKLNVKLACIPSAPYVSPEIQNEMTAIMSSVLAEKIVKELREFTV